jgi:hypothetical protein
MYNKVNCLFPRAARLSQWDPRFAKGKNIIVFLTIDSLCTDICRACMYGMLNF